MIRRSMIAVLAVAVLLAGCFEEQGTNMDNGLSIDVEITDSAYEGLNETTQVDCRKHGFGDSPGEKKSDDAHCFKQEDGDVVMVLDSRGGS